MNGHSFPGVSSTRNSRSTRNPSAIQQAIALSEYQRDRAHALMPRLKELDPNGWLEWFDSDAVPDPTRRGWTGVANAIQDRILFLESQPIEDCSCPASDAAGCSCYICRGENINQLVMASSHPEYKEQFNV